MKHQTKKKMPVWDLSLLYTSPKDPQIKKDVVAVERMCENFSKKYDLPKKSYLSNTKKLLKALKDYENLIARSSGKPILYFYYSKDIDASNTYASAQVSFLTNRLTIASNKVTFFEVSLGLISKDFQKKVLAEKTLAYFKVFLERVFGDAKYTLSVAEEKILNLKSLPAHDLWIAANERILDQKSIVWKNKKMPLSSATQLIPTLPQAKERYALSSLVADSFKEVAVFSEAEVNAVITNKKINDSLRGYGKAYDGTVISYRNDPAVVERLVDTITEAFPVAHRFYALKAKLLKLKKLHYADRAAQVGSVNITYSFEESADMLKKIFANIDPKYATILKDYLDKGQIDAPPRIGKTSGGYCSGSYGLQTFVLLNHTDDLHSFTTFAHEMGHAFHGELSEKQGPIYSNYSMTLAETASTLFESIALDAVFGKLSDDEKIIVLHDKIQDDIATVFRQIACFNFEKDLHAAIREKGYLPKEEIADLHNKNMQKYLGSLFELARDDGYFFVQWSHIRRFFYVYSYAYGMLVTKALLRRYRADKTFWKSIEKFLSAGGNGSPEEILLSIGIDLTSPGFFKEGIAEIEDDIKKLEKLVRLRK